MKNLNIVVTFCPCLFCPSDNLGHSLVLPTRANAPRCEHFSTDICCVIQEGVITVEKCMHHRCHLDKTNMDKTSQHPLNTM